jgi:hypothetical protein
MPENEIAEATKPKDQKKSILFTSLIFIGTSSNEPFSFIRTILNRSILFMKYFSS